MKPRASPHLTPLFYDLGAVAFQRLTRELLHHEPDIEKADEYGRNGQGQRGIDVLALRKPGGIEVGQSKCEKEFTSKKVRAVSDKFFEAWDFWKDKGVKRFILFIAADVLDTKVSDEEMAQRSRFAKHHIRYEIWNGAVIKSKLRAHRSIARNYIQSDEIVDSICGPIGISPSLQAGIDTMVSRMGVYSAELEGLKGKELEALRELSRTGEQSKALAGAEELQVSPLWSDFSAKFRARVLRFNAAVHLNLRHDPKIATELVAKAKSADPSGDFQVIDAYLRYCEKDASEALAMLSIPTNAEARNLRWALLLETGRQDELVKEVAAPQLFPEDAESHRLQALLAIGRGDIPAAKLAIRKALDLAPANRNALHASAITSFYASLSPAAHENCRLNWPAPVPWTFVKRDSESIAQLESAARLFADQASHQDCPAGEKANSEVWQVACLACIDTKQGEAAALVDRVLKVNPTNHGVIVWALFRGYALDLPVLFGALQKQLQAEKANIELHFALWSVIFAMGNAKVGEAAVDEAKEFFEKSGHAEIWLFHKVQFVAMGGNPQDAPKLAEKLTDPKLREAAADCLRKGANQSKEAMTAKAEQLAADFTKTGSMRSLIECCELRLRLRDFAFVSSHAVQLVEGVGTASALRMALEGAGKNEDYPLCLTLLRDHQKLFRDGKLSPDVRALKALAQHKQGDWAEALQEAESMHRESPSLETFFGLFYLLQKSGDTRRCATLSRELLGWRTAKPAQLLQAAAVAQLHDLSLAKQLWRRANQPPIKNLDLAAASMDLAYRIGLRPEGDTLLKRLTEAAAKGKGPLQMKTMDDMLSMMRENQKQAEELNQKYFKGELPVHLLSEQMGVPLSTLFHSQLVANREEKNLFRTPIIFTRAGNRPVLETKPTPLLADITSLTIAADLGLLDKIEATFSPLLISPHVTTSLAEQVQRMRPSQPDRHAAREEFVRLIKVGTIEIVKQAVVQTTIPADVAKRVGPEIATLLETASQEMGVFLSDGPIMDVAAPHNPIELPSTIMALVRQRREFENHLRSQPEKGAAWLPNGTAVLVAHSVIAGIQPMDLSQAVQRYRFMVTQDTFDQLIAEISAYHEAVRSAEWTQALADRIHHGIVSSAYKVVPEGKITKGERHWAPVARTLLDVLSYKGTPGAVFWCDDRSINRHLRVEQRPIIGISEVLTQLRAKKALSEEEYFAALLHLRRSNVRYIPITEGEIAFHLRSAPMVDGAIEETPALSTIRRYLNVCMLDKERLATPLMQAGEVSDLREFEFPMSICRETNAVLLSVWKDQTLTDEVRLARANWIFDNLFVDILGFRQSLLGPVFPAEVRDLTGMMIGALFAEGIALSSKITGGSGKPSPRVAFFDWLNDILLKPMVTRDPTILKVVGQPVANLIITQLTDRGEKKTTEYRREERMLFAHLIHDLPRSVSAELDLPANIQSEVGLTTHGPSIGIDDRHYAPEPYWQAVAEAVNGRVGQVRAYKDDYILDITFGEKTKSGRFVVLFKNGSTDIGRYSDNSLPALVDSVEERLSFLQAKRHWFDCAAAESKAAREQLAMIASPGERIERLHGWRDNSAEYAYRRIVDRFAKPGGTFAWEDLRLPNWSRLLGHLRIKADSAELKAAAVLLCAEEGLGEALRRMSCLPVRLPHELEAAWRELSDAEAAELFDQLAASSSLVSDMHRIRLANLRASPDFLSKADSLSDAVLDLEEGRLAFDCFHTVLGLVDADFGRWSGAASCSPATRVACVWYHASRLHGYLRQLNGGGKPLLKWLKSITQSWSEETLLRPPGYWRDCARPPHVSFGRLVLHGLACLLGDTPGQLPARINIEKQLENPKSRFIRLDLVRTQGLWTNSLGTFLGGASDEEIVALYGTGSLMKYFATLGEEVILKIIEDLANEPHDTKHWAVLRGVAGEDNFPGACGIRLREVLKMLEYDRLSGMPVDSLASCLTFACQQASNSGDLELIQHVEKAVFSLAQKAMGPNGRGDTEQRSWLLLMNALLELAVIPGDEIESGRRFFDYLRRFSLIHPGAAKSVHATATAWMQHLPFPQQTNLWPFLFTARALR